MHGSFKGTGPLPSRVDPLCIQDMARGQKEPRSQELEEALIMDMVSPQERWRLCLGKLFEVLPHFPMSEHVMLERGIVPRLGGHQVLHQSSR